MMQFIKKNFVLLLAFALPISFLLIIAATIYIPSNMLKTQYDFIYATCDDAYSYEPGCKDYLNQRYTIENNTLEVHDVPQEEESSGVPHPDRKISFTTRIFYHDTEANESREISIEEAQEFELSKLLTSPDGVTFTSDYESTPGVFPFFDGRGRYGEYISKGNTKKRMDLIQSSERSYYYSDGLQFLGWIIQ